MQYLGTNPYTDPIFPGQILVPVRNRPGLRLLLPSSYDRVVRPIEIFQDKAGHFHAKWVTGKRRPLASVVPLPHDTIKHLIAV
jgi:hypothetical protein